MKKSHKLILPAALALLVLCLAELLFDPYNAVRIAFENKGIRAELSEAVERWEAAGIEDYSLTLTESIPLRGLELIKVLVRDGEISEVMRAWYPQYDVPIDEWFLAPVAPGLWYLYSDLTVPGLFGMVAEQLAGGNWLDVTFDQESGYVTSLSYNCNGPHGYARTWIADCGGTWTVRSLVLGSDRP